MSEVGNIKNQKQNQLKMRYYHFACLLLFMFLFLTLITFPKVQDWIHAQNSSYFQIQLQLKIDRMSEFLKANHISFFQNKISNVVLSWNQGQIQFNRKMSTHLKVEEIDLNSQKNPASIALMETEYVDNLVDYSFHEELKTLMSDFQKEILLIGDSMLKTGLNIILKKQLQRKLPDYQIHVQAEIGTGLARPEVYNWLREIEKFKSKKVHMLVIFLGTNDGQSFVENKKVYRFGSTNWDEKYSERVNDLASFGCEVANHVYWIGQLPMRDEKLNKKMQHINFVIENTLKNHQCAKWVDSRGWLSGENGQFVAFQNELIEKAQTNKRVRQEDGIHLTLQGADIVSQKIIQVMQVSEIGKHQ